MELTTVTFTVTGLYRTTTATCLLRCLYFLNFTLHPACSRQTEETLVLRQSTLRFPPKFSAADLAFWVAELNATLYLFIRARTRNYIFCSECESNPQSSRLQSGDMQLRHDGLYLLKYI